MSIHVSQLRSVNIITLKSQPPLYKVKTQGLVPTSGWTNAHLAPRFYIDPPADGILDFDFVADPPTDTVLMVISPIDATTILSGLSPAIVGIRVHAANGKPIERKFNELGFGALVLEDSNVVMLYSGIDPRGNVTFRNWRFEDGSLLVDADISASVELCVDIIGCRKLLDVQDTVHIKVKLTECLTVATIGVLSVEACYNPPKELCVKLSANLSVWQGTVFSQCLPIPI
jgi:hypothetical protein